MLHPHHPTTCEGCAAMARLRAGDTRHATIIRAAIEPRLILAGIAGAVIGWITLAAVLLAA